MNPYGRLLLKIDQMGGEWELSAQHWRVVDGESETWLEGVVLMERPRLQRVEVHERATDADGLTVTFPVGFFDATGLTMLRSPSPWARGTLEHVQRLMA
jgi:hypothetical protein